jgi:signal transduction histidine kinase
MQVRWSDLDAMGHRLRRFLATAPASNWVSACLFIVAATFVASTLYSRALASQIDAYANSIAHNGVPGVVDLATVTESIRQVSARATLTRTATENADRAAIHAMIAEMDATLADYGRTDDYPGEHELDIAAERQRGPFLDAVEQALRAVDQSPETRADATDRLIRAANAFSASIRELMLLNAAHVSREGLAITEVRKHTAGLLQALRWLALVVATFGMVLASSARSQHVALADRSKRLAEARASELELFAGRVAHDLRAPLTVIAMRSSATAQSNKIDVLKSSLERIARQSERMADIIDALLNFARAGGGPEPGTCNDVAREVEAVLAESRTAAQSAGVDLSSEPLADVTVACSPTVLGIVLSNLVRNAVKYIGAGQSEARRITVRGQLRAGFLRIEVEDTGPGLPEGDELRVFEPFVRVARDVRDGIGLGLATVKRLVEAHGGAVGVHSEPGRGCRFWFDLPAMAGAALPSASSARETRALPS